MTGGCLRGGCRLNVMALVDSSGIRRGAAGTRAMQLADYGLQAGRPCTELKRLFEHATTFGSLIQVPEGIVATKLSALKQLSEVSQPGSVSCRMRSSS